MFLCRVLVVEHCQHYSIISILVMTLRTLTIGLIASSSIINAFDVNGAQKSLNLQGGNQASQLLDLHKVLVEIESITGNEEQVGEYLLSYLENHNFTTEVQLVPSLEAGKGKQRQNVFAYKGQTRSTRILVTSHMDTVAPYLPYEIRNGNEIWGRGSSDAKGCIASQIIAVQELFEGGEAEEGDIGILFVVGEERDGAGMKKANELFPSTNWEAVVFGEPSDHKLVLGHKGALVYEITAHGKAAHSSYPELGVNANSMLIRALSAIDSMELPSSEKYGNTTTNIGVMSGGVAMNIIPARASATILTRLAAGTPDEAMAIIEKIVNDVDNRLNVAFGHRFPPVDCDVDIEGMCPLNRYSSKN